MKSNESVRTSFARRREFINLITIAYFLDSKDESLERYVDFLSEEENFAVIQLLSPHIIKYFSVSLILNKSLHKNRKFDLHNLIEAIRRKIFKQQDPFT